MNKLVITEPGWKNYTGDFGGVAFENGVSVEPVPSMLAASLAGIIRFRTEDGSCPSPAGKLAENRHSGAPVARRMRTMQERLDEEAKAAEQNGEPEPSAEDSEQAKAKAEAEAKAQAEAEAKANAEKQKEAEQKVAKLRAVLTAHNEAALKELAGKEGISGLRTVADEINTLLPEAGHVKSNSIPGLIEKIVALRTSILGEA